MGRTGKWFAMEHWGVEPDIMVTAKALGGGFPLSGVTGKQEIMDAVHPGGVGTTFGGNPTACRAGLAVFDIIESEGLLQRAAVIGEQIRARFRALQRDYPVIGDVRGIGAMAAIELVEDPATKKPAGDFANAFRANLYKNGVINIGAGTFHNVVRILVPLTIEDEVLARGLDIVEQTLAQTSGAARLDCRAPAARCPGSPGPAARCLRPAGTACSSSSSHTWFMRVSSAGGDSGVGLGRQPGQHRQDPVSGAIFGRLLHVHGQVAYAGHPGLEPLLLDVHVRDHAAVGVAPTLACQEVAQRVGHVGVAALRSRSTAQP